MSAAPSVILLAYLPELRGGQVNLLRIARHLHAQNIRTLVVVPQDGELARRLQAEQIPWEMLKLEDPRRHSTVLGRSTAYLSIFEFRRLIHRQEATVVYIDGPDHVLPAHRARLFTRTSLVWHVQTFWEHGLDQANYELSDLVVPVSSAVEQRFFKYGDRSKLRLIANAVEPSTYSSAEPLDLHQEFSLPPNAFTLMTVGEHEPKKGTDDLLDAFALFRKRHSQSYLLMAGRQNPEHRERYLERVKSLGCEAHVRWLGYRNDLPRLLRSIDVFVFPSHAEGLSLALLEAMAAGCSIVASDIPANREVLGANEALVPIEDPKALADALLAAVTNRHRQADAMAARKARVLEHYSLGGYLRSFERLLTHSANQAQIKLPHLKAIKLP